MHYRVIDTDSHVNEPPHTWQDRLPSRLRERGPRVVEMKGGHQGWAMEGRSTTRIGGGGGGIMADQALKVGGMVNVSREMSEKELEEKPQTFDRFRRGNYEAKDRLDDMALDGVDASVLYPGIGMHLWSLPDSELRVASMRSYNDWLVDELCSGAPDRLFGLACLPVDDGVQAAVQELRRSVEKGHKGAFLASYPEVPFHDPMYDPLWAAAEELGVPLHWHRANGRPSNLPRGMSAMGHGKGDAPASVATRFFSTVTPAIYMLFHGVFQRFPGLRMVTAETDFGWLPFMMQICDDQWTRYAVWYGSDADKRPSDYIREQFYCTFMDDEVGCAMLDYTGTDNIMWSSDYPHGVTTWPKSRDYIEKNLGRRSTEEREKILARNAARLYGVAS